MRVVIAPDSFKECLSAAEVCEAIAVGVLRAEPDAEVLKVPMADGGEGTVDSLVRATGGRFEHKTVTGPLKEPVEARFGILGDGRSAVIEMSAASGLALVPRKERNPLLTTTFGTGELLLAALDAGACRLIVGIGGSATNDGGVGLAQALGYQFLDASGRQIGRGGGCLGELDRIVANDRDPRLTKVSVEVACDVTNPLTGSQGASAIYGPQKGATPEMIERLDENLSHLARIVQRDLDVDIKKPGSGAAGGLGGGMLAFCGATLRRGIELVIDAVDLRKKLEGADLCLTGEGAIDHSSQFGKTAVGVAAVCQERKIPTVALAGAIEPGAETVLEKGITAYFSITPGPCSLEQALASAPRSLADTAEKVVRLFLRAKGGGGGMTNDQ